MLWWGRRRVDLLLQGEESRKQRQMRARAARQEAEVRGEEERYRGARAVHQSSGVATQHERAAAAQ